MSTSNEILQNERLDPPTDASSQEQPVQDNAPLKINVNPLDHGFIAQVGCQKFAIETREKLIALLDKYLANPNEIQKQWFDGNLKI